MDLIISTPEELREFIPAHDYRNLDTIRGFLINSQNTFLRQRIGQPLLSRLLVEYADMTDEGTNPYLFIKDAENDNPWRTLILLAQRVIVYDAFGRSADIRAVNDNDMGLNVAESDNYDAANDKRIERYKLQMQKEAHSAVDMLLIQLEEWQMQVAQATSENEPETPLEPESPQDPEQQDPSDGGQEQEPSEEEGISAQEMDDGDAPQDPEGDGSDETPDNNDNEEAPEPPSDKPSFPEPDQPTPPEYETPEFLEALTLIVTLWQKSPTYYLNNGLLFNTATDFNLYVDIYDSRDRFITLLPDIRYCQELHIEAEIGIVLLSDLIDKHRAGSLNAKEQKAYIMLQRTLSLYVEARSKMFSRSDAKDEATGYMHLTLDFIRRNQVDFTLDAIYHSPLFDFRLWPKDTLKEFFEETQIAMPEPIHHYIFETSDSGQHTSCHAADPYCREPGGPSIHQGHRHNPCQKPGMIAPPEPSCNGPFRHRPHGGCSGGWTDGQTRGHWSDGDSAGFCETSMI